MKAPRPNLDDEDDDAVDVGPPLLLTLQQAAPVCQVSLPKMGEWSHLKGFPVIRRGRLVRVHARLLDRWLAERALAD
jgi:excisionase family DNA binding protein